MDKRTEQAEWKIYLIIGNHDIKNLRQDYRKYFEQVVMQMYIEVDKQKIYLNHCPFLCYGGSYNGTWQLSDMYIPAGTTPGRTLRG